MSNLVHFEYAPPKSWEQFEELCADLFSEMWDDPAAIRYGRAGQSQNGVDIVISNGGIYPIGLQCKKKNSWPVKKLTKKEVRDEISKADKFNPKLEEYYILTTAESDATLISEIANINIQRVRQNKFKINILFWSDIVSKLAKYENVVNKHYNMGGKENKYTPLLATWYVKNGKVELNNDSCQWMLEVKEKSVEFLERPHGNIVIRQRETDELLEKIRMFQKSEKVEDREELYKLRNLLQKEVVKEKQVSDYIKKIFTTRKLIESIVEIEPENYCLHEIIATIIERKLSKELITEEQKIFLFPPQISDWAEPDDSRFRALVLKAGYDRNSVLIPSYLLMEIMETERNFKIKYKNNISKVVLELPMCAKNRYVIPKILLIIFEIVEKSGRNMEDLERSGFLDINEWGYELY